MHTTGTVCIDVPRSTYSRWIIECPLCVSHSEQACTHAWQPMQRCGSMKNSISVGHRRSPGGLLLRFEPARRTPAPSALRMRTAHTLYSGIFEIGSWAAIVTRLTLFAPAQWYGTNTVSGRIVVTTWHRTVRLPRRRLDRHPVAVRDAVLLRQDRVQFQQRLRVLIDQRADPPRLVARTGTCSPPGRWSG